MSWGDTKVEASTGQALTNQVYHSWLPVLKKKMSSTLVKLYKSENNYLLYGISRVKKVKKPKYLKEKAKSPKQIKSQ